MEEKIGGYVSRLIFNNGTLINLNEDDIVVFVGPNNAGKSQSLKDIYTLCKGNIPTKVVKNVEVTKQKFNLENFLKKYARAEECGSYKNYRFMNTTLTNHEIERALEESQNFKGLRDVFVMNLKTDDRLSISNPVDIVDRDEVYSHPIHYVAYDSNISKWLSENFEKAFGSELIPNYLYGKSIPLCIGKSMELNEMSSSMTSEAINEYANILEGYDKVHEQGDGIRSFAGILLYLVMKNFSIYLIDEPESFLHAPQANIMGRILAENTENKQVFISTHSEEVIKGLLSVNSNRVKIIRITRENNINNFSILNNEDIKNVWSDPILKHSNILSSLFHKQVILCESDSDCKMYSIIEDYLCSEKGRYSETLYIHCGGKQRIAKVASALKALNVDVKVIVDIDVLNDENIFKGITDAFNIEWNRLESDYKIVISNLHSSKEKVKIDEVKFVYEDVIKNNNSGELSKKEIERLKDVLKIESPWKVIKSGGISAFKPGSQTESFNKINQVLKENNIYIVPVGELEMFVKSVGGHGPDWVNNVLEKYSNLSDDVYKEIREFVQEIIK